MRNFLSLLFFIVIGTVSGQSLKIINLERSLSQANSDTGKIALLIKISSAYTDHNPIKSVHFAEEALLLSKKNHYKEAEMRSLNSLAFSLFVIGNYSRGLKTSLEALKLAQKLQHKRGQVMAYNTIGNIYRRQGAYKSAVTNLLLAKDICDTDKSIPCDHIISTLGICYLETGKIDLAMDLLQRSYQQQIKSKSEGISITYNRLGDLQYELKNIPLALEYYRMGIKSANENDKPRWLCFNYLSLADLYLKEKQTDSSIVYGKKALTLGENKFLGQTQKAAAILSENYNNLKESDSCLKYLRLAMVIKDTIQSNKEESEIQNLVFEERLQKIETAENEAKLKEERSHNLQYSAIAAALILFIIVFLLLSHSILVNESIIRFLGILSLLIVFEFINLLLHPYLGEFVHHSPILMLSMMVFIAALLIPIHHKLEHWITNKLVEKNTQIRLTAAKKTIEAVEKNNPT
jgi:tetratricopeptide (TPR) repeat protein